MFASIHNPPGALEEVLALADQLLRMLDQSTWILLGHDCLAFWGLLALDVGGMRGMSACN